MIFPDGHIICDWEECPSLRGSANHWWLQFEQAGRLLLMPWDDELADELARFPGVMHLCGIECGAKSQSAWMLLQIERARKFGPQLVRLQYAKRCD